VIGYDAHQAQVERDRRDRAERAAMARELAVAREVAEALAAWRRDPTPASWDRLMTAGHAYEKAVRGDPA
jgi:hypothetical protein